MDFRQLFDKYVQEQPMTPEEIDSLWNKLNTDEEKENWLASIEGLLNDPSKHGLSEREKMQEVFQKIIETKPVISLPKRRAAKIWRYAAAASVILMLAAGSYFLFFNKDTMTPPPITALPSDIKAPQTNRASITLADGQKIYLDSSGNGVLTTQNKVEIQKSGEGRVVYNQRTGAGEQEIQYNTLTNPRGSKVIEMTLADGSQVWLNAGSSVTYPVAFVGNERKVTVTGEAYFEVKHDASKPFIVSKRDMSVQVLGTHFNVNAYDDEVNIRVTLLEGSVRVKSEAGSQQSEVVIKPGEQAEVNKDIKIVSDIDTEAVMAWKNGLFNFNNADIQTVLRQVGRWYDVEVAFEGAIPARQFAGEMQRNLTLLQVLTILEKNNVHFSLQENKLVIQP